MALINLKNIDFNWYFLIELIIIVIIVIFYLFFFNRALGSFVAFVLRAVLWRTKNAYFECESLQISPLGGRVLFKNLRYSSRNQTIRICKGHVTWRYWKLHVRDADNLRRDDRSLPCRITVDCSGLEWFLYNRTPIYDAVLEQLCGDSSRNSQAQPQKSATSDLRTAAETAFDIMQSASRNIVRSTIRNTLPDDQIDAENAEKPPVDWLKEVLPIEFHAKTGSIVLANRSCHSVLIAGFEAANGTYGAVKSRSSLDLYKNIFQFTFTHPKIIFRTNPDFEGDMTEHGRNVAEIISSSHDNNKRPYDTSISLPRNSLLHLASYLSFAKLFKGNSSLLSQLLSISIPTPPAEVWQGLSRYQIDGNTDECSNHPVEYAKVLTLVDSPEIDLVYYFDDAGEVPQEPLPLTGLAGLESLDIGNGDLSPEWGINLNVKGGYVNYGPWADRQRVELQNVFFPPSFTDAEATPVLKAGDTRVHVALKIFVEFAENTTLRLPTREPSKNWKYETFDDLSDIDRSTRPYGWLEFTFGKNSNLSYFAPMVATESGYDSLLEVHGDTMELSSSVNYVKCVKAETFRLSCLMPAPLVWDASREWTVNVSMDHTDAHILRDHITLMQDLVEDWTTQLPDDPNKFVPFSYVLNVNLDDYRLHFFLNDHNIINNPTAADDNTLLKLSGPLLTANTIIPERGYEAHSYLINYKVVANDLNWALSYPGWNTHSSFATPRTQQFAHVEELIVDSSFFRYSKPHPNHVDSLDISLNTSGLVFRGFGWVFRHFLNLRDNYFGGFCHFLTLEEYRYRHRHNVQGDPLEKKYRPGQVNDMQVSISWNMSEGVLALPQEIYDCKSAVLLSIPEFSMSFRLHDYFMELNLNVDPIGITHTDDFENAISNWRKIDNNAQHSMSIESLQITGHRLFGPQPRTSTYVCIWDIHFGILSGDANIPLLHAIHRAVTAVGTNYTDHDNALPTEYAFDVDPDMTLLSIVGERVELTFWGGDDEDKKNTKNQCLAAKLCLHNGFTIFADDVASKSFKEHMEVDIPIIDLGFYLLGKSPPTPTVQVLRNDGDERDGWIWAEVASITTDFHISLGQKFTGWEEKAKIQNRYVKHQDSLTKRCPFLYGEDYPSHLENTPYSVIRKGGLILPSLEQPYYFSSLQSETSSAVSYNENISDFEDVLGWPSSDQWDSTVSSNKFIHKVVSSPISDQSFSSEESDEAESVRNSNTQALRSFNETATTLFGSYATVLRLAKATRCGSLPHFPKRRRSSVDMKKPLPPLHKRVGGLSMTFSDERRTSEKCIVVHIVSRSGIDALITPSVTKVISNMQNAWGDDGSLERWIDSMYLNYTKHRLSNTTFRYTTLQFGLSLPKVNIHAYHHTSQATASKDSSKQFTTHRSSYKGSSTKKESSPGPSSLFSLILFRTGNLEANFERCVDHLSSSENGGGGRFLPADFSVAAFQSYQFSISSISLEIFNAGRKPMSPFDEGTHRNLKGPAELPGRTDSCVLDLNCDMIEGQLSLQSSGGSAIEVSTKVDPIKLSFVDTPAELVAAATYSWVSAIQDYSEEISHPNSPQEETGRLVAAILRFSKDNDITTDPTFLNRVSYLVQTTSSNLRSDDGWKILGHLRYCMRLMDEQEKQRTWQYVKKSDHSHKDCPEALLVESTSILSNWRTWEIDPADMTSSEFLRSIFLPIKLQVDPGASLSMSQQLASYHGKISILTNVGPLSVQYHTPESKCANSLVFGPFRSTLSLNTVGGLSSWDQRLCHLDIEIQKLGIELDSQIFSLISYVAKVRTLFESKIQALQSSSPLTKKPTQVDTSAPLSQPMKKLPDISLNLALKIRKVDVSAISQGLELSTTIMDFTSFSNGLATQTCKLPYGRLFFSFHNLNLAISEQAPSTTLDDSFSSENDSLPVIVIDLSSLQSTLSLDAASENTQETVAFFFTIHYTNIYVPRSVLRMFNLLDDWKAGAIPNSRLLFKELKRDLGLADLSYTSEAKIIDKKLEILSHDDQSLSTSQFSKRFVNYRFVGDMFLPTVKVQTLALSSLTVEYNLEKIYLNAAYECKKPVDDPLYPCWKGGLRVLEQSLEFISTDADNLAEHRQLIPLPKVTVFGNLEKKDKVNISITISSFTLNLSASIIDSVLAIQKRFGTDIDEVLALISSHRQNGAKLKKSQTPYACPNWVAHVLFQGFKVIIDSPASVQYFEAESISGQIGHDRHSSNDFDWEVSARDLNLSVAQKSMDSLHLSKASKAEKDRRYRLAYFIVDVTVNNRISESSTSTPMQSPILSHIESSVCLNINIPRLHAVMQAGATDALAEIIDFYYEELRWRRATRREEVEEMGARLRKTFHISSDKDHPDSESKRDTDIEEPPQSWIEKLILTIRASNVGIAIPLQHQEIEGPSTTSIEKGQCQQTHLLHPAFLTSIKSMSFAASKGSAGFAEINSIAIQFVPAFDQGKGYHFDGFAHETKNRMQFPSMKCIVKSSDGHFWAESSVSGNEIDLEPSVVLYAFKLFDVFQAGKQRLEKIVAQDDIFRVHEVSEYVEKHKDDHNAVPSIPMPKSRPTLKGVKASFEFAKGSLRLHSYLTKKPTRSYSKKRPYHRKGYSFSDLNLIEKSDAEPSSQNVPDVLTIPGLTLYSEYVDSTPIDQSERSFENLEGAILHVDATMHASNNTLYPSLIPFFHSATEDIQRRMSNSSNSTLSQGSLTSQQQLPVTSMQINVSLRIDKSKLEVSCKPTAPVSASLSWHSGGFLLSMKPSKRDVRFVAIIDEIGVDLRHTFSPEKCLGGSMKGLIISASMNKRQRFSGDANFLSLTVNIPEIGGEVNLRQLHDLLCLKIAWADRLEELQSFSKKPSELSKPSHSESDTNLSKLNSSTEQAEGESTASDILMINAFFLNVGMTSFVCNMGHSIGTINASVSDLVITALNVPEETSSSSISFREITATSTGRLSGNLNMSNSSLQKTLRARRSTQENNIDRQHLLNINIELGALSTSIQYDYRKIVLIEADPSMVIVVDDWSKSHKGDNSIDAELSLDFTVKGGAYSVIGIAQTVPTLYKIVIDVEKLIEERKEKAKLILNPKVAPPRRQVEPKRTVSSVASVLLGDEINPMLGPAAVQIFYRLQMDAERLRLVIFPDYFTDSEVFRADAGKLNAELSRGEDKDGKVHRNLILNLGFFSVRKLRLSKVHTAQEKKYQFTDWQELFRQASDKNIFRVPTTKVSMKSDQAKESNQIYHRFALSFVGQVEMSLNYALLKTLGDLVTLHQNGMKRVQANIEGVSPSDVNSSEDLQKPSDEMPAPKKVESFKTEIPTRILKGVPEATTARVTMPRPILPHTEPGQSKELEFIALENVIEQPQLNLLGDATPPLEWLGVQRAKFPGWIHSGVTLTLEELLLLLSKTYKKQLSS